METADMQCRPALDPSAGAAVIAALIRMSPRQSPRSKPRRLPAQTTRDLRAINADGVFFSVMVGAGETYLTAFALAVGMHDIGAGLVSSVPMLVGALLQLVTPLALRWLGSQRRWVVLCAAVQAASFAPLVIAAWLGHMSEVLLFAVAAVYWGAGLAAGPAWNTWMSSLVPQRLRASFFASRSRWCQIATVLALVGAGLILQRGRAQQGSGDPLWAFAAIFLVSGLTRAVSVGFLASQSEPRPMPANHRLVPMRELLGRFHRKGDMRLLSYMLAVTFMVQISGPYFSPYMLSALQFSYHEYLVLLAAAYASKSIVLPFLGGVVRRIGARATLWIGGIGICPLPWLWTIGDSFEWLIVVQVISGAIWAAYELATFLMLFDHIPEHERTSVLTTYNLLNAAATVVGSLLGAGILRAAGVNHAGYMTLFYIVIGARMLTLMLLGRVTGVEARHVILAVRTLAVRPASGGLSNPVIPSLESDGDPKSRE